MGFHRGPKIVTDGLVLLVDPSNSKSYFSGSSTIVDLSGNGNDGTLINSPNFSLENNGALLFTTGSDYVDITTNPILEVTPDDEFTITAWFKTNELAVREDELSTVSTVLGRGTTAGSHGIGVLQSGDKTLYQLRMGTRPVGESSGNATQFIIEIETDTLYNATLVHTPVSQSYYVDGVLIESDAKTFLSGSFDDENWNIFRDRAVPGGNREYMSGSFYYGSIYNRALSEEEILNNYNAVKGRFGIK